MLHYLMLVYRLCIVTIRLKMDNYVLTYPNCKSAPYVDCSMLFSGDMHCNLERATKFPDRVLASAIADVLFALLRVKCNLKRLTRPVFSVVPLHNVVACAGLPDSDKRYTFHRLGVRVSLGCIGDPYLHRHLSYSLSVHFATDKMPAFKLLFSAHLPNASVKNDMFNFFCKTLSFIDANLCYDAELEYPCVSSRELCEPQNGAAMPPRSARSPRTKSQHGQINLNQIMKN